MNTRTNLNIDSDTLAAALPALEEIVKAAKIDRPPVGSRVILTRDVERYPHFIAREGRTGVVVDVGDPRIYAVRMDEHLHGAEDWSNEVHWLFENEEPADDLRVTHVNYDAIRKSTLAELRGIVAGGGPSELVEAAIREIAKRKTVRVTLAVEFPPTDDDVVIEQIVGEIEGALEVGASSDEETPLLHTAIITVTDATLSDA